MLKYVLYFLAILPTMSQASTEDEKCANVGYYLESVTLSSIVRDMNLARSDVLERQTKVEMLGVFPVSETLARQLAKMTYEKDHPETKENPRTKLDYYSTYHDDNVKSIAAKYTFVNKAGKKNIVISLGYLNDNECSVDYGGYLTLLREF